MRIFTQSHARVSLFPETKIPIKGQWHARNSRLFPSSIKARRPNIIFSSSREGEKRKKKLQSPSSFSQFRPSRTPKMSSQSTIDSYRENAEIYTGDAICKQKSVQLLEELHLPNGLLPLEDILEVGYNRDAGFVWLRQKAKRDHVFRKIGKTVSYAPEVTAFVEDRRMKKMTGVKSKELLIWVSLVDMFIDDPASGKITFKSAAGLGRTFPVSAFELEVEEQKKEEEGKK